MSLRRIAAAAAHFGRGVDGCLDRIEAVIGHARDEGAALLVLPDGALGGYLTDIRRPEEGSLPPSFAPDDPLFDRIAAAARDLVVCLGYSERTDHGAYQAAVCLTGDGVLGRHRKVHQPPALVGVYAAGSAFCPFDTPLGRMGMLTDYDKTFPEAARSLALDGARTIACLSAWPASVTMRATQLVHDRQTRLFDLYDCARAAENQVVWVSANQTGRSGALRFFGHAKVVGPGGEILARTGVKGGLAVAELDIDAAVDRARAVQDHLEERRLDTYSGGRP